MFYLSEIFINIFHIFYQLIELAILARRPNYIFSSLILDLNQYTGTYQIVYITHVVHQIFIFI